MPNTLGVAGAIYNLVGGPAPDGSYQLQFALYKDAVGGVPVWQEAAVAVPVKAGTFSHVIGLLTPLTPDLLANAKYLGQTVGNDPEMPRIALQSVAYALRAAVAEGLDCTSCLAGAAIKPSSVTSDKVGFAYAAADSKGGSAIKALDLQCTGCVSVSEIAWDADVNLVDKNLSAGSVTALGSIAAKEFIGDGSKLSGINLPSGKCPVGKAVIGLTSDGQLICGAAVDPSALPPDGLNEISNNLLTNQFNNGVASKAAVPIPDHFPLGVTDSLDMPDYGSAQKLTISLDLVNSDTSTITVTLTDPAGVIYTLYQGGAAGKAVKTSYPDPTATVSGDLTTWVGKNPVGKWQIKVVDDGYLNNAIDGQINSWSISMQTLSTQQVAANGAFIANSDMTVNGGLAINGTIQGYGMCMAAQVNGICLASAGINGIFLAAAKSCAAVKADICTDSQAWVLRKQGMLASNANWTNSFADNDAGGWSELNGGTGDDHTPSSNWQAPCCYNLTPHRSTDTKVAGVRVVYVHNAADTYFRNAAMFCSGLQADLCDKAQYWVLRQSKVVSVAVWSSDHSDNDNTAANFEKGIGAVADNPSIDSQYGFACCATDKADLTCPGTDVSGVCVVKVNNTPSDWNTAATDCASVGARVCSISQSAILRDAKTITAAANWTASYSDNDGGNATVGVGSAGDDHPNTDKYGYACCL